MNQIEERVASLRFQITMWSVLAVLMAILMTAAVLLSFARTGIIGGAICLPVSCCVGTPALIGMLFMVWRNDSAMRTERRHMELIASQRYQQQQSPYRPPGDSYHDAP